MNFTISRSSLITALQRAYSSSGRTPILSNALLSIDECNQLHVTGSDVDVEQKTIINTVTDVDTTDIAAITVPAKKLLDVCKALPDDSTLQMTYKNSCLHLKSGKSKFQFCTLPACDFPSANTFKPVIDMTFTASVLNEMIESVGFAMAKDDARYFLNGMLMEFSPTGLTVVGADGHRLSVNQLSFVDATNVYHFTKQTRIIVPHKAIDALQKLLTSNSRSTVRLLTNSNALRIEIGDCILTANLVGGQFPDYVKVIPKQTINKFEIDRKEFKEILQRISILSNSKKPNVELNFDADTLTVSSVNEFQERALDSMTFSHVAGSSLTIAFNVNYLLQSLQAITSERILFSANSELEAVSIMPSGTNHITHVIMPVRI